MGKKGGLFRYADAADKFLMLSGILGSLGDGLMTPLTMIVLSGVVNEYGNADISFSNHVIDKVSNFNTNRLISIIKRLCFTACFVFCFSFALTVRTQAAICCHWSGILCFCW